MHFLPHLSLKVIIFSSLLAQPLEDESRIVGGQDARMGQFPYQLSWRDSGALKFHFCGAEILDAVSISCYNFG